MWLSHVGPKLEVETKMKEAGVIDQFWMDYYCLAS